MTSQRRQATDARTEAMTARTTSMVFTPVVRAPSLVEHVRARYAKPEDRARLRYEHALRTRSR